jgi:hypothetical protein
MPRIDFVTEADQCPICNANTMGVRKTRGRLVATLDEGLFEAREHLKGCDSQSSCVLVGSEQLARIVPPRQRYSYDMIVHVAMRRYLGGKQRAEIREELIETRGIELSEGTISNLCDRFLIMLEMLHLLHAPALRAALGGGYSLHIDATCDKGKGGLLIGMDGFRGWILAVDRITSERADLIRPLVEKVVSLFGEPLATVRDLGDAMAGGVKPLRERGIPDLLCHYHFLRAVGDKLLNIAHSRLRGMLRLCKLRVDMRTLLGELRRYRKDPSYEGRFGCGVIHDELLAVVHWFLEGEGKKELSFPFSLHHRDFVRRCQNALHKADSWLPVPRTRTERRALRHLGSLVRRPEGDSRFTPTLQELDRTFDAFCELRDVLRLNHDELSRQDQRPDDIAAPAHSEHARLQSIEKDLRAYTEDLRVRFGQPVNRRRPSSPQQVIVRYLDEYGEGLFGHPVVRNDEGTIIGVVKRTNNPPEHFFGQSKQSLRRRLGRANLGRDLQQQPAQAALARNLLHSDYVRVLCGSLDNLASAFADLRGRVLPEVTLRRDHRDTKLQDLVRKLLKQEEEAVRLDQQLDSEGQPGS